MITLMLGTSIGLFRSKKINGVFNMPLVKAKCTSCGGMLDVDNGRDAAICPYCNSAYIVEKAIQEFNIKNTNYINNAYFYNTKESEDELLKRGIKQLELNVWKDAAETFRQMTKLYPENYKGWLGMCIVDANDDENLYDTENLRNNVIVQCPQNMVDPLFGARVRSEKRVSELMDEIQDYNEKINYDQRQVESLKNELIEIKEEKDHLS